MLASATTVMIIGMCVVFSFLLLIVGMINAISFVMKFFPEPQLAVKAVSAVNGSSQLQEIAIVIAAAKSLSEGK